MNVLGIETSCDETSVSVVKDGKEVLSNEISSSISEHSKYGGVIPEIASRMQLETIAQVADCALERSGLKLANIGLISVTSGPGLLGSLLTGISFAKALSLSRNIPLIGIDHVYSHIYANFLTKDAPKLPFVALVVSGGHTSLFYVKEFGHIKILGQTHDDACGEAYDKVAKIMGLGYPGGPLIEKLAKESKGERIRFRCSGTKGELDFSFSGIKTGVMYYLRDNKKARLADVAYSFQEAVIDTLIQKSFLACKLNRVKQLVVGGGVAANGKLRQDFMAAAKNNAVRCFFPTRSLCTDNAAMVAGFGYQLFRKGQRSDLFLNVDLN